MVYSLLVFVNIRVILYKTYVVLICGKYNTLTLEFKINIAIRVPLHFNDIQISVSVLPYFLQAIFHQTIFRQTIFRVTFCVRSPIFRVTFSRVESQLLDSVQFF